MFPIYMIRHGKPASVWGQGDDDPGLDDTGREQARAAARALMALPDHRRPRRVVSSPLRRSRETAAPFAEALGVPVEIDPAFGEIPTPAALDAGARGSWLRKAFAGAWADIQGDVDYDAWRAGVVRALAEREGAAIFSHYVAINAAVSLATGVDAVLAFRPDHASITVFEPTGWGVILVERGREAETGVL